MYTKISCEFDYIEHAEQTARLINERVGGSKKITIKKNKQRFLACANNKTDLDISDGKNLLMFPFSTHSNNFISGLTIRETDESQINEMLCTKSVKMEILCEESAKQKVVQFVTALGAYNIKS